MHQADDGLDLQLAPAGKTLIAPPPVVLARRQWCRALPQHRKAQAPDTQCGKTIEVIEPMRKTRKFKLIAVPIAETINRALGTGP